MFGLRRETDERALTRLHGCEASPHRSRAGAEGSREIARQRIVAARIQHDDIGVNFAFHRALHKVKPHRLKVEGGRFNQVGINGNKVVLATHLQAMADIEEQRQLGALQP